jgi:prepilin-type N-terminal cleavage/methylation domain-containing protein
MAPRIRHGEHGFTLVELLVVIMIVGILAVIGFAAFLDQKSKAQDAEAKTAAVTAAKAMAVYSSDTGGYAGATPADLAKIERALGQARGLSVDSTADTYTVSVDSAAGDGMSYSVERKADGSTVRDCTKPGLRLCRADPDAVGDRW